MSGIEHCKTETKDWDTETGCQFTIVVSTIHCNLNKSPRTACVNRFFFFNASTFYSENLESGILLEKMAFLPPTGENCFSQLPQPDGGSSVKLRMNAFALEPSV